MKPLRTLPFNSFQALALLLAAFASHGALAQDASWYGAINLGNTSSDLNSAALRSALQGAGYNIGAFNADNEDSGWKVAAGYRFTNLLALEASYADLGEFDALATLLPTGRQVSTAEIDGLSVDLVGSFPLTDRLSALGRIGINYMGVSQEFSNSSSGGYFANGTARGAHEKFGVGLEYRITNAFAVRTELERFHLDDNRVSDDSADLFSLGLVYRFGARPVAARQPVTTTPAPTPTPAPAPAPRARPPVTITLAASALFDFDRSELKPAGRAELDALVRDLEGLSYEVIIVTGHTDRIGTRDYNLALSERRAVTVRDYLVGAGVPSGVITARAVNSDEPVTTPEQCQGPVSDALKACLQPDRRVEVEVSGTRAAE